MRGGVSPVARSSRSLSQIPKQAWIDWEASLIFNQLPGTEAEAAEAAAWCVGSTEALQMQAAELLLDGEMKRSVSFYLGEGSSQLVQEVAPVQEDEEPHAWDDR